MKKLVTLVIGLVAAVSIFSLDPAMAQLIDPTDSPGNVQQATGSEGSFRTIIRTIVNFVLFFLGIIATIMVIYGGFLYVTSAGNDQTTEKAKKIILFAAVGIVIILISFALVNTLVGVAEPGAGRALGNG